MKLTVHVDGGARGNPGPAAIAAVVSEDAAGREVLTEASERIGTATNNVAEYKAMLLGIETAKQLGGTELDLVGDSELIVKQVQGKYRVKDAGLKPLHAQIHAALTDVPKWSIRHVKRARNAHADRLVNEALDA